MAFCLKVKSKNLPGSKKLIGLFCAFTGLKWLDNGNGYM
jgi:hypothetical protein